MKLSVFVVTYNQEQYIRECLDSIVMQQVEFDYEVIIGEDCSTDSTPQICDEYAERYPFIHVYHHTKNLGLIKNWAFVLRHCTGEYIAMCEGDDYWTDPLKLQKQVNFMDAHPEYSITEHRYDIFNQEEQTFTPDYLSPIFRGRENVDGIDFDKGNHLDINIQTMTVVCRAKSVNLDYYTSLPVQGDMTFFYTCLLGGKGYCLNFKGAVYRRSNQCVYTKKSNEEKHYIGFHLYSKMYLFTQDDVYYPHAISHMNFICEDTRKSIMNGRKCNIQYFYETLKFMWAIGYYRSFVKYLLKIVYWNIKYCIVG